jgi:hypothetical protein
MSGNKHLPRVLRGVERNTIRTWLVLAGLFVVDIQPWLFAAGCALVLLATVLRLWAKGYLQQREVLTTGGPYRWTRNPFYLFNLVLDLGVCLIINRWWLTLTYLVVWAVVYDRVISREEDKLTRIFGQTYLNYKAKVARLIPLPAHALPRRPNPQRFSWRNPNLAHRTEYTRALRALGFPLALYVAWDVHRDWPEVLRHLDTPEVAALVGALALWAASYALKRRVNQGHALLPPWVSESA